MSIVNLVSELVTEANHVTLLRRIHRDVFSH